MATKQFYHNIDLVNVGQLLGTRKQNLTSAERATLGGLLGAANEGLFVWDTEDKRGYTWDGVQWVGEEQGGVKQFFDTVNLVALTPLTVSHNLGLGNRNAFTINAMFGNSQISLDVDSIDENSLTLTSLVSITGVDVTVQGSVA